MRESVDTVASTKCARTINKQGRKGALDHRRHAASLSTESVVMCRSLRSAQLERLVADASGCKFRASNFEFTNMSCRSRRCIFTSGRSCARPAAVWVGGHWMLVLSCTHNAVPQAQHRRRHDTAVRNTNRNERTVLAEMAKAARVHVLVFLRVNHLVILDEACCCGEAALPVLVMPNRCMK